MTEPGLQDWNPYYVIRINCNIVCFYSYRPCSTSITSQMEKVLKVNDRQCACKDDGDCLESVVQKLAFFNTRMDADFWLCQKHLDQWMKEQDVH